MSTLPCYLLDTNILVAFIRGGPLGTYVDKQFSLQTAPYKPLICVVTIGEIRSLSLKFGWGPRKLTAMDKLLDNLVHVSIDNPDILDAYAEIDHLSNRQGRSMGKNDVWIAATAKATGATLLTTDTDFDHLTPTHVQRIWIDPAAAW